VKKITHSSHSHRRAARLRGLHRKILATSAAILLGWGTFAVPFARSATVTWQGDLGANWKDGTSGTDTNWTSNTLPAAGDSLVFDLTTVGVANLATNNDLAGLVLGGTNAITFTNDTGAGTGFTLAGNDVTLGGNITSTGTTGTHTHTISLGLILNGNRTVTAVSGTTIAIDGIVSETGGARNFLKAGAGTVTLSAANSFTGALSINQGTLSVNSIANSGVASALGAGSAINLGNAAATGTLIYTGAGGSTNRAVSLASTAGGDGTITNNGSGALVFSGTFSNAGTSGSAKTLTLSGSNTGANDFQSALVDSAGGALAVVKTGAGAWTLSGTSSFTGPISVSQGTLSINSIANTGANSAIGAGGVITIGSGTNVAGTLTYTGAAASTNRTVNLAATTTGAATINGSGTGALIFTGTFTNAGTGAKLLTLGGTNADANEIQGVIPNGSGTLSVTKTDAGSWILSGANTYSGTTTLSSGALVLNNAGSGGASSAIGTGGFTFAGGTVDNTSGSPITLSTNNAVAWNGSLGFGGTNNLSFGTGVVTISNANQTVTLNGGSTLAFGEAQWNSVNASRTLTVNQGTGSGAKLLLGGFQLNTNADTAARNRTILGDGGVEISGLVANGNLFSNSLAYSGTGTLTLSAANTYAGGTTLNSGTLALNSSGSGGASSAIGTGGFTIAGGTIDNTSGASVTLSTNNPVAFNGSFAFGGTNDLSLGTGVVSIGNANRDITLNGSRTLTFGEVQWNSTNGSRVLTVNQGTGSGAKLVLVGFQLNVNADTAARNRTITGSGNVEINAPIVNGNTFNNGLVYSGTGTLTLSSANSYTGATIVNGGTLRLISSAAISSSSGLTVNAGSVDAAGTAVTIGGALTLGAATTTIGGQAANLLSSVAGGSFTLGGNVTYNTGSTGLENGQATISADLILTADRTITVNESIAAALKVLVSGVISGGFGLTKGNGGTLRLTGVNTFTGQAALNNGTTEVTSIGNIGTAGSLGTADKDAAAAIIRFGNGANTGALSYLGSGGSTNRKVQIGSGTGAASTGGAIIQSNGTGALAFTASTFNTAVSVSATGPATARVLTLGGANTGANTIQGAIVNNTGAGTGGTNAVAVTKQDAGKWELAGNSTYTGPTTVSDGTLVVSGTLSGTTRVDVNGGTLLLGNSNRINNAADVSLGGGTFATGGFSEGDATSAGLGSLTLTANSVLDFGAGTGSLLHFGSVGPHTANAVLSITNFDGAGNPGDDRLIFSGSASAFTSAYAQADVAFNGVFGYATIQFEAGNYEIVPVPEPATAALIGSVALCALIGCRERRRFALSRRVVFGKRGPGLH
jgi:fibronectin-binding autotransporter adhesin